VHVPLATVKKGVSMANRGLRLSSSSRERPPASGALAPAAAGRQARADERRLPATLSMVAGGRMVTAPRLRIPRLRSSAAPVRWQWGEVRSEADEGEERPRPRC
jgi:hypothetical protein